MKTNKPNWDFDKPVLIVSEIIKLCGYCGKRKTAADECSKCGSTEFHEVFEHMAHVYRNGLAQITQEIERAEQEVRRIYSQYSVTESIVEAFVAITRRPEYDATAEQEQEAAQIEEINEWLPRYDDDGADDTLPNTDFGSRAWFAGVDEIEP